ncbi:MAG TPA: hypothetical protein VG370_20445 [Chloroflexota bacterium]|nr:hypothetical protein [Chloroflexota bacterium]
MLVEPSPSWREPARLTLWRDGEVEPIRVAWAGQRELDGPAHARFAFEPVEAGRLTFCLDAAGRSGLRAWYADDVSRTGDARFEGGRPVPGELAFRVYRASGPLEAVRDAVAAAARWPWALALGLALLLATGLAGVGLLWAPETRLDVALAAAPGLGLLLLTLGWWLADLAGLAATPAALAAGGAVAAALAARRLWAGGWSGRGDAGWLAALWLATLVTRLAVARDLALPAWVDGVHHSYLTQLLAESGRLPPDFGPLLGFGPFTYHFGFHAYAASVASLAGAAPWDAVLVTGQLLGAAAAPSAYLLTRLYGGSARAALVAGALAGLVSVMPAYFVSWSRFTQLAGLVAFPVWLGLARRAACSRVGAVGAGLASAALLMVHPRVAVLAGALLAAEALVGGPAVVAQARRRAGTLLLAVGAGLVVAAPWLTRLTGSLLPRLSAVGPAVDEANRLDLAPLQSGYDPYLYGLAAAAAVGGLVGGGRGARVALLWLALALAAANPGWLGLPGSYLVSNGSLVISLWLPAAGLVGGLVGWIGAALRDRLGGVGGRLATLVAAPAALVAAIGLAGPTLTALNPSTVLATAADRRALEAAARVLPADAVVATNVREWQLGTYMGADGGYWIGVVTPGRAIAPPILYGLGPPERAAATSERLARWAAASTDAGELAGRMRDSGVEWLFVGERGGPIDARWLTREAGFEPVVVERGAARLLRLRRG